MGDLFSGQTTKSSLKYFLSGVLWEPAPGGRSSQEVAPGSEVQLLPSLEPGLQSGTILAPRRVVPHSGWLI